MKIEKRNKLFFTAVLCIALLFVPQTVYGADYAAGQSLVAGDQTKASRGLSFPGLDITWLDFGDDHIVAFSSMDEYSEGVFSLRMSSGTLCFDTSGKVISAGGYDEVYPFSDGMALVRKYLPRETEWQLGQLMAPPLYQSGYIDREGSEAIPLGKLDGLNAGFHEGLAVLGNYGENKGFINKTGEIVIPQVYSDAGDFSGGLAPVQSAETKLWGYIDSTGALRVPMEFETAEPFLEGVAYVSKNGLAGYIDENGETVIDFQFQTEENPGVDRSFHDGLAATADDTGKYGYIDRTGNFVIPAKYLRAEPFTGGVAAVTSENRAYINGYGSSFLINRQGERLTPLWYYGRYQGETMKDGLLRAIYPYGTGPNQSIAFLNQFGAEVIPSSLNIENLSGFNEGVALLIGFGKDDIAVGLVKKPENIEEKKAGKLIKVYVDGKLLDFTDTDPIIESSRTLVPMKDIFESLGAEVRWDAENYTVYATKDGTEVSLKIGASKAYVNGKSVDLDVPARIQNARTLVPVKFIAESFHANVTWDDTSRTVSIRTEN